MSRTRAWCRYKNYTKAKRKRQIDLYTYWCWDYYIGFIGTYKNLHQYSKNKIHCSCPWCSPKTRNKGKRRHKGKNYAPSINYRRMDLRRQQAMDADFNNYMDGEL